ncbi:MAG: hypothetical protein EB060_11500 [Proteobacteria bacterium]|nr:hypothetical protein [Pseudomonadota bacterium]
MSVLDKPSVPEITPAIRTAAQIKQNARATYQAMMNAFEQNARLFWKNPQSRPSDLSAALGTDAAEVFALHAKLGSILEEVKPGCTADALKLVGNFTVNSDGTVTINSPFAESSSTSA